MLVESDNLVAASDIADLLNVHPSAVSNWIKRYDNFPKPVAAVARGKTKLWDRGDIADWYRGRAQAGDDSIVSPLLIAMVKEGDK